jgi:hypothetical protein
MLIVSFAWTADELIALLKDTTRRDWKDSYAKRFKKGMLVQAYNRSPRFGGHRIAIIRLTRDTYKQALKYVTDADEKREGGKWGSAAKFIEAMGGPEKVLWVIEFEVVSIEP